MSRVALLALGWLLSGCVVASVVDTAADVAGTVIETTVDVAAGTVKLVLPSSDDDED